MATHISRLLLIVVAVTLPLAACMTSGEQQAAIAANDDAACRSVGAKPGTPAYDQCLENRSNQRAVAQREADRSMQRSMYMMNQSAMRASRM